MSKHAFYVGVGLGSGQTRGYASKYHAPTSKEGERGPVYVCVCVCVCVCVESVRTFYVFVCLWVYIQIYESMRSRLVSRRRSSSSSSSSHACSSRVDGLVCGLIHPRSAAMGQNMELPHAEQILKDILLSVLS